MFGLLLGVVVERDLIPQAPLALRGILDPGKDTTQGRFARAVDADQHDPLPPLDDQVEVTEHLQRAVVLADATQFQHHPAAARGRREVKPHPLGHGLRCFQTLQLVQLFDPALHLRGFARVVAKGVDEPLYAGDLFLLLFVRFAVSVEVAFKLARKGRVIAGVFAEGATVQSSDARDHAIEKLPIMRDHHDAAAIGPEVAFQPQHGVEVEVVGGLV